MSVIAESHVEEAALAWLAELGYAIASGPDIGPDGAHPERAAYGDVILVGRLRAAIAKDPKAEALLKAHHIHANRVVGIFNVKGAVSLYIL